MKSRRSSRVSTANKRSNELARFGFTHQLREACEQIMAIPRSGRCLRMILHREHRLALECNSAVRTVEKRYMRFKEIIGNGCTVHGKAVVHGCDLHFSSEQILHGMICAVMALAHLDGLCAGRERKHLMSQTDAEDRELGGHQFTNYWH